MSLDHLLNMSRVIFLTALSLGSKVGIEKIAAYEKMTG